MFEGETDIENGIIKGENGWVGHLMGGSEFLSTVFELQLA